MKKAILEISKLSLSYAEKMVMKDFDLSLEYGDILGIAGESGSGKSTLLKGIVDPSGFGLACQGSVLYKNHDISSSDTSHINHLLKNEINMIPQNPYGSFNPIRTFKKQFKETLKSHDLWDKNESITEILDVFHKLGLPNPVGILDSYPFEMSGGMNQRITIALNLILKTKLLLADEPTSALDIITQAQVLNEFRMLKNISDISMILVSHNLSVLAELCNKIIIMKDGEVVEQGITKEIFMNPKHAYTKSLLEADPALGLYSQVNKDMVKMEEKRWIYE